MNNIYNHYVTEKYYCNSCRKAFWFTETFDNLAARCPKCNRVNGIVKYVPLIDRIKDLLTK